MMMPQVISVEELRETKKIVSELGAPENFKIGIMVETPAAVQVINELCLEGISFISFGTNDLTQYILAIDRNNSEVQYIYDEMNPAVLSAISYVIRRCKRYGVETSICGQAGSKPEMVKFLVSEGIDSISTNADAAAKISELVAEMEGGKKPEINEQKEEPPKELAQPEQIMPETQKEEIQESQKPQESEVPVPSTSQDNLEQEVMEEEAAEILIQGNEKDEYMPGEGKKQKDIPSLNDSIPVDSSLFNEKEFDLENELKFE
jgi:phosphoenolpyruvate-protein kinase (PTS system EI component)